MIRVFPTLFIFARKTCAIMRNGERRIDALEDQETGNHREMADNDEVAILSFFREKNMCYNERGIGQTQTNVRVC